MTLSEARRHQGHMCDVYENEGDHIGVIMALGKLGNGVPMARVGGHPQYRPVWIGLDRLGTACKIEG